VCGVACNLISVRGFMVNGKVLWGIKFGFMVNCKVLWGIKFDFIA
jgi:hypothetical protein